MEWNNFEYLSKTTGVKTVELMLCYAAQVVG
jgi:hypothetical protein